MQFLLGMESTEMGDGFKAVHGSLLADFPIARLKGRIRGNCQAHHLHPVRNRSLRRCSMRRNPGRTKNSLIEVKGVACRFGQNQMTPVNRIKGPAEESDLLGA